MQTSIGLHLGFKDEIYKDLGAEIVDRKKGLKEGNIICSVNKLSGEDLIDVKENSLIVSFLDPFNDKGLVEDLKAKNISSISMELIPRTTRAQKMDALSSQANLGGYAAVLIASNILSKSFPMMMTAAGTISPSKVFVVGVGVAGLQAIATAKRLGAKVEAFDTRPVVEEQVKSLGARFVKIDIGETEEWWDPNGKFAPLHIINPLRSNYVSEKVDLKNKNVIDVACGGGLLVEALHNFGANVTGIDISDVAINTAQIHAKKTNCDVTYINGEAEELLPEKKEAFDVVTCLEAIEHVPDPQQLVKTCSDLCKPGGTIVFSTINRNPKSFLFAIIGAEYILNLLPKGTHEFKKFIKPSELSNMMRNSNLEVKEIIGMSYNPLTKKYWLGKDVDVNYLIHAEKSK